METYFERLKTTAPENGQASRPQSQINVNCNGPQSQTPMDDERKLYICLEAKHNNGGQPQQHVYLICSLKLKDLTTKLSYSPALIKETSFECYPSMGCGFYQSKIVFAGGQVEGTDSVNEEEKIEEKKVEQINYNGLVTFDMKSRELSFNSFPPMLRGKLKPLVFQLYDKLYVLDTISRYPQGSFEYFYPKIQEWNLFRQPTDRYLDDELSRRQYTNYPCLVFGSACFLSISFGGERFGYVHHPHFTYKAWFPLYLEWHWLHPSSGVATFYHQPGLDEFIVISFTKRVIRAQICDIYDHFEKDYEELFRLPSSSKSVEEEQMSGHFADFGDGIFSLTAFDDVCIQVCTFQIFGLNMPIKFKLLSHYEYRLDALSFGVDVISVVGCFAPHPNVLAINHAEEVLKPLFSWFGKRGDEDPDYFEFHGAKIPVPKGCPDAEFVAGPFDTPLAPDPVEGFCVL